MTKARRAMQEDIRLIDLVIELVDARIPMSSRNPDIDVLAQGKSRILLLNKSDLADEGACREWKAFFEKQGIFTALVNSVRRDTLRQIRPLIEKACAEKIERDRKRGILNRPVRAMICGIPNVGKSTFINSFAGKAAAKTGNRPGVTKGKQWIRLDRQVELLDTPGILWPKFEDRSVGEKLAMTGAIRDEILDSTDLAGKLITLLEKKYPQAIPDRYFDGKMPALEDALFGGTDTSDPAEGFLKGAVGNKEEAAETQLLSGSGNDRYTAAVLNAITCNRHCLKADGAPDPERAASLLIDDFRKAKLGRITLDDPDDFNEI